MQQTQTHNDVDQKNNQPYSVKTLAKDPGCTGACRLIPRFISAELRATKARWQQRLGLKQLSSLVPDAYRIPDSSLAQQATELVRELSDEFLLNHCYRTYAFGCILGHQDRLKFDREVFYIASIMHDLGLTELHKDKPGSFEYVGAKVAHQFCIDKGYAEDKAALVHDAIALHSAVGIADQLMPEIALVHLGAGVDVLGIRLDEIPPYVLTEMLQQYPRLDFKQLFAAMIKQQAVNKPNCHIAGMVKLGFEKRVKSTAFDN